MANDTLTPLGPLFGPNFITIQVNDDTNRLFQLEIFPDANNVLLKDNGLATHYYFMPQRIYLAKKQDSPADFDFGATIFKGLLTTETDVAVTDPMTESGAVSVGGGICSFSTTFAIPESVIRNAIAVLKKQDYPQPTGFNRFARYFQYTPGDPTPELGIVPIVDNDVTIEVPRLSAVGTKEAPFFIDAQGTGKGSVEATSISSFLVTLNMLAAGAIVGSLKKGVSPFTVHYNLKQQFYINACDVVVHVDMTKTYDAFSAALSVNYFGIVSANLSEAWSQCLTTGAITTSIKMNGVTADPDIKKMIDNQVEELRKTAFDAVKADIFDFHPSSTPAATNSNSLVGVSIKAQQDRRSDKFDLGFRLDAATIVNDTVSGDLNDLEPAIKANLDKYLAVVDVGEYFKKVQIAATTNVTWSEKVEGADLRDPIRSIQVEAAYPDFSQPLGPEQKPNLVTRANGFHYTIGQKDPKGPGQLAVWTKDNANDIVNISFLRLGNPLPQWDADQVKLRKTIVYDPSDPRVEFANNKSTIVIEEVTKIKAPVITPDEVGYIFVKFCLDRPIRDENVTLTLTCALGQRKDTLTITKVNQKNVIWEVFSDKYFNAPSFQYDLKAEVTGPNFTDDPVEFGTQQPVVVPLPSGRVKYIGSLILPLPARTAEQNDTINRYIKAMQGQPVPA
jgi:hypothetical protein